MLDRIRLLTVLTAALLLAGLVASASAVPSKSLTRARAEAAIIKKLKSAYRSRIDGREIPAGCKKASARRYTCTYGVLTKASDETDDQDRDPYRYEGKGSVAKSRSGKLVVRVTRPR